MKSTGLWNIWTNWFLVICDYWIRIFKNQKLTLKSIIYSQMGFYLLFVCHSPVTVNKNTLEDWVHHVLNLILVFLELEDEINKKTHWKSCSWDSRTKLGGKGSHPTSFLFSSSSSSFSLALFPATLFRSASYCLCVLSWLMLRFRATFTRAVISFIAAAETRHGRNE